MGFGEKRMEKKQQQLVGLAAFKADIEETIFGERTEEVFSMHNQGFIRKNSWKEEHEEREKCT